MPGPVELSSIKANAYTRPRDKLFGRHNDIIIMSDLDPRCDY